MKNKVLPFLFVIEFENSLYGLLIQEPLHPCEIIQVGMMCFKKISSIFS